MKKGLLLVTILSVPILCSVTTPLAKAQGASLPVIFGKDDRQNLDEVSDPRWLEWADSTVAFFNRTKLEPGKGSVKLRLQAYGERYGLCRSERFFDEGSGSDFSGVLIAPDLVLTAGHTIRDQADCDRFVAVFGFDRRYGPGSEARSIPTQEVYGCARLITREKSDRGDYTVIQLRRKVVGHRPLKLMQEPVQVGTPLVVIGHPNGLPTIVAGVAHVQRIDDPAFLEANTDTFNGNSGSPVLEAHTGEIVGILVNGSVADFRLDPVAGCSRASVCHRNECGNEILTRASVIRL